MKESAFNNKLENDLDILKEIFIVVKLANKYCNKLCKEYNITPIQFQALYLLSVNHGNDMKMSTLGDKLDIGRSDVTVLVDKMALEGLVKRRIDEQDRRIRKIIITEKGRKIMEGIFPSNEIFKVSTFDFMEPEEQKLLYKVVEKVKGNLESKMLLL
jgi:MarR family 2-MHQ and catechol resistance regulon transcriptional repressor